MTDYKID
jgi:hypothetical protein